MRKNHLLRPLSNIALLMALVCCTTPGPRLPGGGGGKLGSTSGHDPGSAPADDDTFEDLTSTDLEEAEIEDPATDDGGETPAPTDPNVGGPDLPKICEPGVEKGECAGPDQYFRCNSAGYDWYAEDCEPPAKCYLGSCAVMECPPGETMCLSPTQLAECVEATPSVWTRTPTDDCSPGTCKAGVCGAGCGLNLKLNVGEDCQLFEPELTPEPGEPCVDNERLALPSSAADEIAIFDISVDPPTPVAGSPFATCDDPSRILMDVKVGAEREEGIILSYRAALEARVGHLGRATGQFDRARELLTRADNPLLLAVIGVLEGSRHAAEALRAAEAGDSAGAAQRLAAGVEAVKRAGRVATDEERSPYARSQDVRFAVRIATTDLDAARASLGLDTPVESVLEVGPDIAWIRPPGGERVPLGRRHVGRRVIAGLVQARLEDPGTAQSIEQVLEFGWPGETILWEAAMNRVYVTITRVRNLGLGDVLLTTEDGYLLDPGVVVRRVDDGPASSAS